MNKKRSIAVISMVRNDSFFADKWISYYGKQLGFKNLYLFIDGLDQPLPKQAQKINCKPIVHRPMKRVQGDRFRARMVSQFAQSLFSRYSVVLAMDIDEFLIVDPNKNQSLHEYLTQDFDTYSSLSALGIDVGQHPKLEKEIDLKKPFLTQRSYAQVSDRYTKPVVALQPLQWGSGFHRVKGQNYRIDSNLFLFHFGLVDRETTLQKSGDKEVVQAGWRAHLNRRVHLYDNLESCPAQDADSFWEKARKKLNSKRKWYAWNKPAPLKGNAIVLIPERFTDLV